MVTDKESIVEPGCVCSMELLKLTSDCGSTCRQLMEQYGFVVPGNPHDRVKFPVDLTLEQQGRMSHKAVKQAARKVLEQKRQSVALAAVQEQSTELLLVARLDVAVASIIKHAGWRNLKEFKETTTTSTVNCAQMMLKWVLHELANCPTAAAGDAAELSQHLKGTSKRQTRLRAALKYRLERKRLLQAAAAVLDVLVNDGESILMHVLKSCRYVN